MAPIFTIGFWASTLSGADLDLFPDMPENEPEQTGRPMSDQELDVAKQRSPTYPYISLDLAIERAAKLFEQVRDTPQPREVMAKVYGKPATSSATIQTFATLTQYGLLEPVIHNGQRRLRVTQLTRSITNPNAPEAVVTKGRQEAALKPSIFRELWDAYGSTSGLNDSVVLYYLTVDREQAHGSVFTDRAAQEVLRVYRATLAYAGLSDSDKVETDAGEVMEPEPETLTPEPERRESKREDAPAPRKTVGNLAMAEHERELQSGMLSKTAGYRVIVSGRIGVKEVERLIKKLEMDKEILADAEEIEGDDY
jgi:hypothetical protein